MYLRTVISFILIILVSINCDTNKSPLSISSSAKIGQITSTGLDFAPYWSLDDKNIIFSSARNTFIPNVTQYPMELWIMSNNGENQHEFILLNDYFGNSTDVKSIFWVKNSNFVFVKIQSGHEINLLKITFDMKTSKLTTDHIDLFRPISSPNGLNIAYLVSSTSTPEGSPNYKLYLANADLNNSILLEEGLITDFTWSQNSKEIIYSLFDRQDKNNDLWKVTISGENKSQFTKTTGDEEHPACSSDGNYIAFTYDKAVYLTPSQKFQPKKLISNSRIPKWIPNSHLIAVYNEQTKDNLSFWTELWIIDLNGNVNKKICQGHSIDYDFSSSGEFYAYSLFGNIYISKF